MQVRDRSGRFSSEHKSYFILIQLHLFTVVSYDGGMESIGGGLVPYLLAGF